MRQMIQWPLFKQIDMWQHRECSNFGDNAGIQGGHFLCMLNEILFDLELITKFENKASIFSIYFDASVLIFVPEIEYSLVGQDIILGVFGWICE